MALSVAQLTAKKTRLTEQLSNKLTDGQIDTRQQPIAIAHLS